MFLISHGQCNCDLFHSFNCFLSVKGIKQAQKIGRFLSNKVKDCLYGVTSPFYKCMQTSIAIQGSTGLKFSIDKRLGYASNCYVYNPHEIYPTISSTFPESRVYREESCFTEFEQFITEFANKNIIVVTHKELISKTLEKQYGIQHNIDLSTVVSIKDNNVDICSESDL